MIVEFIAKEVVLFAFQLPTREVGEGGWVGR